MNTQLYILFSVVFINGHGIVLKTGPFVTDKTGNDEIDIPVVQRIIQTEMKKISRTGVYSTSDTLTGIKHYRAQQIYLISVDSVEYIPVVEAT